MGRSIIDLSDMVLDSVWLGYDRDFESCERPLKYFDASSFTLCNDWKPSVRQVENTKDFGRHLARHLQQIALEALPLSINGLKLCGDLELAYADVAKHNTKNDIHVVVHDRVYDKTKFVDEHPDGEKVLLDVAGADATEAFEDVDHSDEAREMLDAFLVGGIVERREGEFSSIIPGMGAM
ncbi:hypothetical protein QQZ08_009359 [Neonectria magnoliae]|uniref:Cytochrome b5 heme-binding domain-containing protein n=1 Tax=Neonectria magnoliae TaxID=2732573 RepID=A0ABR1HPD0_9HYPO